MPLMKIVGMSDINAGDSSKKTGLPYKMQEIHFAGQSIGVTGTSVEKVTIDLLKYADRLPVLSMGAEYYVETNHGFLKDITLVNTPPVAANVKISQQKAE